MQQAHEIAEMKQQLRRQLRQQRQKITANELQQKSAAIAAHLDQLLHQLHSHKVLAFRATSTEVQINDWMEARHRAASRRIYLPVTGQGGRMDFWPFTGVDGLQLSRFQIEEPIATGEPVVPAHNDAILVPGLCFDEQGYRLGYGGGFYDRYLERYPRLQRIGLCLRDFYVQQPLPRDGFDQAVHWIVHDQGIVPVKTAHAPLN